jgi:tRNA-splicing endonuclease subunit Sen54
MMIPYHSPIATPEMISPYEKSDSSSPTITYHVYKPNAQFKKTSPGMPDFYVSVINSRETMIPTEPELEILLRQTPYHPWAATNSNVYQKAKTGVRNVILAVVDQGLISFVNFSDAAFGANALWQRPKTSTTKGRGGFKGKGRR